MGKFHFLPSGDILTSLILGFSVLVLATIRYTNTSFFFDTVNHLYPILKVKKTIQKTNNKSYTFFSLLFFLLFFGILNQISNSGVLINLTTAIVTGFYLLGSWIVVNQFILKSSDLGLFFNKKIKTLHFITLLLFIILTIHEYLFNNSLLIILSIILFSLVSIYKSVDLLINRLSIFHIILYICTLEIIPLLLIVKWYSKL